MKVCKGLGLVALLCFAAGCPEKEETKPTPLVPPPVVDAGTAAPTAAVTVEQPPTAKIEPRVKVELDGRADGITGTAVAQTGATGSLQVPATWTTTKGEPTVSKTADGKSQVAVSSFVAAEGPAAKVAAASTALGLSNCTWNPPEALTVGKNKLPATAADGLCTRGAVQARAAWVAPTAESLLVVGSWDPDGDAGSVFGSMRAIAKPTGGDPTGIAACCNALSQNAKSAPPDQQLLYGAAISLCQAAKSDPNARQALAGVRAALRGANVPASCL
jgi:hypothetical protein